MGDRREISGRVKSVGGGLVEDEMGETEELYKYRGRYCMGMAFRGMLYHKNRDTRHCSGKILWFRGYAVCVYMTWRELS
jgi:hypothetical protein